MNENIVKLTDDLYEAYALVSQISTIAQVATNTEDSLTVSELCHSIVSLSGNLSKILFNAEERADTIERATGNISMAVRT